MPESYTHAQILLPNRDGLAANEFETSFSFITVDQDTAGVTPAVVDFFNTAASGVTHPVGYYLGSQISRGTNACQVRYYDKTGHLDGTPSGPPYQVDSFTMADKGGSANNLPNQCTSTLSFYDALDAEGTTRGDQRGRMFLGPLTEACVYGIPDNNLVLTGGFSGDVIGQFKAFCNALLALSPVKYVAVWSRKHSSMTPVLGGWMGDQIDTQRRRRYPSSSRSVFTLP